MNNCPSDHTRHIAERAYYIYLERVRNGIPGSATEDWLRAVAEQHVSHHEPPAAVTEQPRSQEVVEFKPTNTARESLQAAAEKIRSLSAKTGDDLTRIKGIGPKIAGELHTVGVQSYSDLASWNQKTLVARLPRFASRGKKGGWIRQAKMLAG